MKREHVTTDGTEKTQRSRLGPMGIVLAFGVVSMLADVVYEGARSIGVLGASLPVDAPTTSNLP